MVNLFYFLILIFYSVSIYSSENEEIEIDADKITHDKENKRMYATGNVHIISNNFKIFAQKVFVNTDNQIFSARNDIKVFYSDGNILKTEKMSADRSLNNAKFSKSYLFIPDDSDDRFTKDKRFLRIAANSFERRNKTWEIFNNAIFTACDICFDKKKKVYKEPLIQLKANKVIHNHDDLTMRYYDSYLEFSGNKIFYLPYFSHPSPKVKRKSGFLVPKYRSGASLGESFEIPYYYVISDYEDLTFAPKLSTKKNPVGFVEHRKNLKNGKIQSKVSATISNININQIKKNRFRGHIKSIGEFEINKNLVWDYEINRTSDRNYLQAFKYEYSDTLNTKLSLNSFKKNNIYTLDTFFFQDLRSQFNQKETPRVFPRIKSFIKSSNFINKTNISSDFEFSSLTRDEGTDVSKLFFMQSFEKPFLFDSGSLLKIGGHLSSRIYKIENNYDPIFDYQKTNFFKGNIYPQLTVDFSKPLQKTNKVSKQIFNPKIFIVAGSNNGNDLDIPNEDSRNFDLDYTDLFHRNRLSGSDRLDNGTRIDYGFSYTNQNKKNSSITSLDIGQSYRLKKEVYQTSNSGSNDYFSNIVSGLYIKPTNNLNFNSYFSLDSYDFSFSQIISKLNIGGENNKVYASHLYSKATEGIESTSLEKRNQMQIGFSNQFSKYWRINGSSEFKIIDELKFLNWRTKIRYEDECFGISFSWNRQYTYNSENPTSNNFLVLFSLKKIMESDI